eukprot:1005494-Ditylum_brightwellii.AAC.1
MPNACKKDAIAGLAVGIMIVPQSMSHTKLAGLPVQFRLYSSLVPVYAYAVFGTSQQLAVGPVTLKKSIVKHRSGTCAEKCWKDSQEYIKL